MDDKNKEKVKRLIEEKKKKVTPVTVKGEKLRNGKPLSTNMIPGLKKDYSDDETIEKSIQFLKKGYTEEELKKRFNLSTDDLDLIDFVMYELWKML